MSEIAAGLWRQSRDLADACLAHPFVQGIASGALPRARFQVYVAQDARFLESFARAYALALARCPDRQGLEVFRELLDGVFEELRLHRGYAERWQVSLEPEPLEATSAYCDFLLRTASLEPVGHTIAALAPCMRLYAFLGRELLSKLDPASPYREWVETYAGDDAEALAARLESLFERYPGDAARRAGLYRRAMGLELAFFQAAWEAA